MSRSDGGIRSHHRCVRMRFALSCLVLVLSSGLCRPVDAVTLHVSPRKALYDQPVTIQVTGVPPGRKVVLQLATTDADGVRWMSHATFVADKAGLVDPATMAPVSGNYRRTAAMGLFWSMLPPAGKSVSYANPAMQDVPTEHMKAVPYRLAVSVDGKSVAHAQLLREPVAAGVTETVIRHKGMIGNLYVPAGWRHDGKKHPAVIALGGAEGGLAGGDIFARWLASHGYVALSLGWYHMPGLQNDLVHVPIEELVRHASEYLDSLPFVDARRIGLMGGSWGGTAVLAAASRLPHVRAVVSWVGSVVVFNGLDRDPQTGAFSNAKASPFLIHGQPMPFADFRQVARFVKTGHRALVASAISPIWRIHGPVLFVAGGDDTLGISAPMARLGMDVLKAHHHAYADRALIYAQAGHLISPGYQPALNINQKIPGIPPVGGTPAGYARADAACGSSVLEFLRKALAKPRH